MRGCSCALYLLAFALSVAGAADDLVISGVPAEGESVIVYAAVAPGQTEISDVRVTYSSDGWLSETERNATRRAGIVYFTTIPGHDAETVVSYTVSARDTDGAWTYGPTNSYTVRLTGESGTQVTARIMAANTTSGTQQAYESPGIRIFQGLRPDIVGIQEFNYESGSLRDLVDTAFGTGFHYYCEGGSEQIPNGIISRWPITASGEWNDSEVSNRDFAWATIDIPGGRDLHVVSVHLLTSSSSARAREATEITSRMQAAFPSTDYVVLCGDMNTGNRNEQAIQTFETFLSDARVPTDQAGDYDTNEPRSKPYDYVLPNATLEAVQTTTYVSGHSFFNGLVYDSRVTSPFSMLPSPVQSGDSGAPQMQHMAVMKDFVLVAEGDDDTPPLLYPVGDKTAEIGLPLEFTFRATDADGTAVTLTCSRAGACVQAVGNGGVTGTFSWTPGVDDFGDNAVIFTAQNALYAKRMINISVVPEPAVWAGAFLTVCAILRAGAARHV